MTQPQVLLTQPRYVAYTEVDNSGILDTCRIQKSIFCGHLNSVSDMQYICSNIAPTTNIPRIIFLTDTLMIAKDRKSVV